MNSPLPQSVLDAANVSAVTQLVLRERTSRDLGLWEQMRDCFHADSRVRLSWIDATGPEFVERSREMAARGVRAAHRLGPVLVTLAGDRAIAGCAGIIDIPFTVHGVEAMLSSHARFLFRAERRRDQWRLAAFDALYLRDEITTAIPGAELRIDAQALQGYRASYRLLAYCLALVGFPVRDDLAGQDRADLVADVTREVYQWAGLEPPR
jgi:hypothetical protein